MNPFLYFENQKKNNNKNIYIFVMSVSFTQDDGTVPFNMKG